MNKLEKEIYEALLESAGISDRAEQNPITAHNCSVKAKATAAIALRWMCDFKEWYDKLSPADKCTVWPPAGSGCGTGLYNMTTDDIVEKFISKK